MDQLFGSKTRVKLLKLFMSNPNRSFYVREITRKVEEQINSVRRELANLLSLGIITSDSTNNKLYYEVDQSHEYYNALRELFTGKRSSGAVKAEKASDDAEPVAETKQQKAQSQKPMVDADVWDKAGNIAGLLYSGVFTRDASSPVDVMIVGDVPVARAEAAIVALEAQEGRELRYAVMELDEWQYRKQVNDKFWLQVIGSKNQVVIDPNGIFNEK